MSELDGDGGSETSNTQQTHTDSNVSSLVAIKCGSKYGLCFTAIDRLIIK